MAKHKIKPWPKNNEPLNGIEYVLSDIKQILLEGYSIKRKNIYDFKYRGYEVGSQEKRFYPSAAKRFQSEYLLHSKRIGRSLLDISLMLAFHIGVEQGRREEKNKSLLKINTLEHLLARRPKSNIAPDRLKYIQDFLSCSNIQFSKIIGSD